MDDQACLQEHAHRVEQAIRQMTGGLIRGLQVSSHNNSLVVTGTTDRYYHKQLATRAAMQAVNDQTLRNDIVVSSR